jgi:hypothetical protein
MKYRWGTKRSWPIKDEASDNRRNLESDSYGT